jgi:hypothetical protein
VSTAAAPPGVREIRGAALSPGRRCSLACAGWPGGCSHGAVRVAAHLVLRAARRLTAKVLAAELAATEPRCRAHRLAARERAEGALALAVLWREGDDPCLGGERGCEAQVQRDPVRRVALCDRTVDYGVAMSLCIIRGSARGGNKLEITQSGDAAKEN